MKIVWHSQKFSEAPADDKFAKISLFTDNGDVTMALDNSKGYAFIDMDSDGKVFDEMDTSEFLKEMIVTCEKALNSIENSDGDYHLEREKEYAV